MSAHILIVDDNEVNLRLAADVLEFDGYKVETALDARLALEALERARPALILMDMAMPGMDGLTLTQHLKANPGTAAIPVVALTASAMKGDDQRMLAAGCDGYLSKPIDTRRFSGQIAAFLKLGASPWPEGAPSA